MGWTAAAVREASVAEIWACYVGAAKANGWGESNAVEPMTRERLRELMEAYPDV